MANLKSPEQHRAAERKAIDSDCGRKGADAASAEQYRGAGWQGMGLQSCLRHGCLSRPVFLFYVIRTVPILHCGFVLQIVNLILDRTKNLQCQFMEVHHGI